MRIKDLERFVGDGARVAEANPDISRRQALGIGGLAAVAASGLAGCATTQGSGLFGDPRFGFSDGPDFSTHLQNGQPGGKDWITSHGNTLVTSLGEGRVIAGGKYQAELNYQYWVEVDHFDKRVTRIFQLNSLDVKPGDYIGRNTILGKGGDVTVTRGRGVISPYHIHVDYLIEDDLLKLWGKDDLKGVPMQSKRHILRLDPEVFGSNGNKLELWNGEDFLTEYKAKSRRLVEEISTLMKGSDIELPPVFNPLYGTPSDRGDAEIAIAMYYHNQLNRSNTSVRPEVRAKANALIRELVSMYLPLTLPFVNREIYEKVPGFYQEGSNIRSYEQFVQRQNDARQLLMAKH